MPPNLDDGNISKACGEEVNPKPRKERVLDSPTAAGTATKEDTENKVKSSTGEKQRGGQGEKKVKEREKMFF